MAQHPSSQRGSYQFRKPVSNRNTSFFKIVHANIMSNEELDLPKGFVKKHGNELSDVVKVEVPNGNSWNINVRKADGTFFFSRSGWKDFVDNHSIDVGHVLFFTYCRKSRFKVIICGMNASEIKYPPKADSRIPSSKSLTVYHSTEFGETSGVREEEVKTPYWSPKAFARNRSLVENSSATQAAIEHRSENPSFMLVMQPSYVQGKYTLNVPLEFVTKYLGSEDRAVNLQLSECVPYGRVWEARFFYYGNMAKFYSWEAFARDNCLQVNDSCVFELIDTETASFAISIYRNNLKEPAPKAGVSEKQLAMQTRRAVEAEYSFESVDRFFIIRLARSYVLQGFLHVRTSLRRCLPEESKQAEIVDSNGRSWYVKYIFQGSNSCLSEGWNAVLKECGLKEDSVFSLEVIDDEDILMRISVLEK